MILYGILNQKKKNHFTKERVEEFTNEKLIIIYMILENEIIQNNLEQISNLKFKNSNLNEIKKYLFKKIFIENSKVNSEFLKNIENQFIFLKEINLLYKTHLGGLTEKEKSIFFEQILVNLKLPDLQNEIEKLKGLIRNTSDNEKTIRFSFKIQ